MKKHTNFSTALWFIPLVAIILALLFMGVGLIGWQLLKSVTPKVVHVEPASASQKEQVVPIVPLASQEEIEASQEPVPQEVLDQIEEEKQAATAQAEALPAAEVCPATAVPVKLNKPRRKKSPAVTSFQSMIRTCQKNGVFPCAWQDNSQGIIKQYWLMSAQGPVQRGIYDRAGNLISETIAELSGTVTSYTEQDKTYYYQGGILVKIRTSPYDNCNFHDWFFINAEGKQDVCQCVGDYNRQQCCARSPYWEGGPRTYCELNPLDQDFCRK